MRVLTPGRCFGTTVSAEAVFDGQRKSGTYVWGVPIGEETLDVPDYFCQATSGNDVNDVVHAKIVDQFGHKWTKLDQWATNGSARYPYVQSLCSTNGMIRWGSMDLYHTEQQTITIDPSVNYKGKKPKRPPYTKVIYQRIHHGIAYKITSSVRFIRRYVDYLPWYECLTTTQVYIYGCYGTNPKSSIKHWCMSLPALTPQVSATPTGTTSSYNNLRIPEGDLTKELMSRVVSVTESFTGKRTQPSVADCGKALVATVEDFIISIGGERWSALCTLYGNRVQSGWKLWELADVPVGDLSPRDAFILDEPEVIGEKLDPYVLGREGGLRSYWRGYLTEHALLSACESLPRLSDNSIQNLCEVVGFIKAAVVDRKIEMPKSLADAWLAYRYQYQTTRLDIEDAIKFVHRHVDLGTLDRLIVGRGTSSTTLGDVTVTCRCSLEVTPKHVDILHKIWRALDQYGLTPDFYYLWDSIPYSFMVDWFLPIADLAGVWDANSMYFSGEYYTLENICYSLSYSRELHGYPVRCYTRWYGSVPSSLHSYYWYEPPSASTKTWGKRILDAASIFIG